MEGPARSLLARPLRAAQLVALDWAVAAGFCAVFASLAFAGAHSAGTPIWARLALVAGMSLPVGLRRRRPAPVFALVLASSVLAGVLGMVSEPFVAAAFAVWPLALGEAGPSWAATTAIGVVSAAAVFAGVAGGPAQGPFGAAAVAVVGLGVVGGTWIVGRAVAERRAWAAASARVTADAAVADERLRIAREMHDVVAHAIGLIAVKAGVANHVLAQRPGEAADALRVIESTSRAALVELRRMLGVLRTGEGDAGPGALAPAPGLGELAGLAQAAAAAGVAVDLDVEGGEDLPEGVGLAVYRIVQEALTNVAKHAGGARCQVSVVAGCSEVRVEVVDDGAGAYPRSQEPTPTGGHGLVGMRERVGAYGGELFAGSRPEGGFVVRARLRYHPMASSEGLC